MDKPGGMLSFDGFQSLLLEVSRLARWLDELGLLDLSPRV
jgi:hypothetical protein